MIMILISIETKSNSQTKPNMPAILLTNACHIINKVDDLHAIANMNNLSLIMVTESWLNVNVPKRCCMHRKQVLTSTVVTV